MRESESYDARHRSSRDFDARCLVRLLRQKIVKKKRTEVRDKKDYKKIRRIKE